MLTSEEILMEQMFEEYYCISHVPICNQNGLYNLTEDIIKVLRHLVWIIYV